MRHRHFLHTAIISSLLTVLLTTSCSQERPYRRIEGYAQGSTFHIIYSAPESPVQTTDEDSVAAMVSRLLQEIDFSISGYNKGSILSRINRGEDCTPDRHLITLFDMSRSIWEETGGLFDVSGGPLFDFWGFGFSNPENLDSLVEHAAATGIIDSLKTFVGMDLVSMENGHVVKKDPRVQLNFNAIAQGYTCDAVARLLDSLGVRDYLVEIGGEIVCKGKNAAGGLWGIGIDEPIDGSQIAGEHIERVIRITDCGITTSGNYRKFHIIDGKKYAHSINPVTGFPVRHDLLSATIISTDSLWSGAISDAYATYCMVLGKEKAAEFIASRPDLRGYLIYDGGTINLLKDGSDVTVASGKVERYPEFHSEYMSPRDVYVWLPDGYSKKVKYDVLYMHDGQMLFDSTWTWNHEEWQVDDVAGKLIAADSVRPFIVVGIAHGDNRYGEYFPEKVLDYLDNDSLREAFINSGIRLEADEYLRFITSELKPFIDSHYSTRTDAGGTFVAGSSMGGLISLYALCEYPEIFGGAACMSTHLPLISSSASDSAASRQMFAAFQDYLTEKLPEPGTRLIYTDRGDSTLDASYPPYQDTFDSMMRDLGWKEPYWETRVFPGASHVEHDWAARLHIPFTFLFQDNH